MMPSGKLQISAAADPLLQMSFRQMELQEELKTDLVLSRVAILLGFAIRAMSLLAPLSTW